jgi:CRISPR system Cascade subunit CasD
MFNNACLAMLLDGPMQSWGFASRFTRRTTALFPTKSGVVGLVAAAMGIDKFKVEESQSIARLAGLHFLVISLPRTRRDKPLTIVRLEDFHTIGGGYDPEEDWLSMPRSAENKTLRNPVVSRRHYLMDARFGVLLSGNREILEKVAAGLRNPRWGVWLGRKCCLPASPLLAVLAADQKSAWLALARRTGIDENTPLDDFDCVEDAGADEDGEDVLNDTPVAFGAPIGQRHKPRRIRKHFRRAG